MNAATQLRADIDIYGRPIRVGSRVRSFDFAIVTDDGAKAHGFDLEGERAAYVDGVVEAIGDTYIDGCPRYTIRVEKRVFGGEPFPEEAALRDHVYPPLNGTPTSTGRMCASVVAIDGGA